MREETKIGVVWNPSKVDEGTLPRALDDALTAARDEGRLAGTPQVAWFETVPDNPGGGAATEALAQGCNVVIAAGGDGTVRAVAEALGGAESDDEARVAELGVVPLGTGNLLARNLGIPLGDPREAFARVLTAEASPLDLGEVTATLADGEELQQGFVVMVGFGVDARMIAETDDGLKAKAGWLAYVESLGRAAESTEVVEFALALDGGETKPERAHTLLIGNCGSIQGGVTLLPDAVPDDGELDLLLLSADSVGDWLDTARNMVWDNGLRRLVPGTDSDAAASSPATAHSRARTVEVHLPEPLAFEVDGDEIGEVSKFAVQILPGALRVR